MMEATLILILFLSSSGNNQNFLNNWIRWFNQLLKAYLTQFFLHHYVCLMGVFNKNIKDHVLNI